LSLFTELKRRNVLKVSMAYLALGWLVVEVANTVTPLLDLPRWLPKVVLWIGIIGLPLVVVFAWIYELTPEGLKRESEVPRTHRGVQRTARWLDYVIFGLLALAVVFLQFTVSVPRSRQLRGRQRARPRYASTSARPLPCCR